MFPKIHLWCNTHRPLSGRHGTRIIFNLLVQQFNYVHDASLQNLIHLGTEYYCMRFIRSLLSLLVQSADLSIV